MRASDILIGLAIFAATGAVIWLAGQFDFASRPDAAAISDDPFAQYNPDVKAASVDETALGTLAAASCKCARSGDGSEAAREECWQDYKKATATLETYSMASACAPISTELECVGTDEGEKCWVTSFGDDICTADEARAVESAYISAMEAEGDFDLLDEAGAQRANDRANAAYKDVIEKLKRGETLAVAPVSGGC